MFFYTRRYAILFCSAVLVSLFLGLPGLLVVPESSSLAVAAPSASRGPQLPHRKMIHLNTFDSWELQCHVFSGVTTNDQRFGGVLCRGGEMVKLHLIRKLDRRLRSRCPRPSRRERRRMRRDQRKVHRVCDQMCVNDRLWRTSVFDWKLASCTLAGSFERSGFQYNAGDVVSFDRDGKFKSARLSNAGNVRQADSPSKEDNPNRRIRTTPFERFRDKERHLLFRAGPFQCYYVYGDLSLVCSD